MISDDVRDRKVLPSLWMPERESELSRAVAQKGYLL
jgi:hypothetical protein